MMVKLRRLWIQLTADRKRFGALSVLLVLGLLLWARIIVISNLPRTAVADPDRPGSSATATTNGGGSDSAARRRLTVVLARSPDRDPFVISPEVFPKPTRVAELAGEGGKSKAQPTEYPEQAEARLTSQLRALVERFTLEALMRDPALAVISGETYRLGESVPGIGNEEIWFKLVAVEERSVILECEGRRIELDMASPRSP